MQSLDHMATHVTNVHVATYLLNAIKTLIVMGIYRLRGLVVANTFI